MGMHLSLHPTEAIEANVRQSTDGKHRWVEIKVGELTIALHPKSGAAADDPAGLQTIAEQLGDPMCLLALEAEAAGRESWEPTDSAGKRAAAASLHIAAEEPSPF